MSLTVDGVWKAGVWATTVWADGVWHEGGFVPPTPPVITTKTGTGGIDKGAGYRRITKPTGLGYPKKKTKKELRQEVLEPVIEPVAVEEPAVELKPIETMTMVEIDHEIGVRLRQKMLDDENARRLLILIGSL